VVVGAVLLDVGLPHHAGCPVRYGVSLNVTIRYARSVYLDPLVPTDPDPSVPERRVVQQSRGAPTGHRIAAASNSNQS